MREKIEAALNQIRPSLEADGGGVELVEVTDDKIARVKLTGACGGCPFAQMTLRQGVERVLKQLVPELAGVEAVEPEAV